MNKTMTDELANIASDVKEIVSLKPDDFVIDIGSNDGTLLRSYRINDLHTIGFEPAENIVQKYGREGLTKVFTDFFNFPAWQKDRQYPDVLAAFSAHLKDVDLEYPYH